MRARMGLWASGVEYEHREILLRDKPADMLARSPKGTVPVFITDRGAVLDESFDILLWAVGKNDPYNWMGPGLAPMNELIISISQDFKHHLDRYKYASRYSEGTSRQQIDLSHREQACEYLNRLETVLTHTPYLMGEEISLADIAIFPFIRQFSNVEKLWWDAPKFPKLHAWLDGLINSEMFGTIMQKHPLYAPETPQ